MIINFHVYPGYYYAFGEQMFWKEIYTVWFRDIVKANSDKNILIVGAHTHTLDFWYEGDYYAVISTPAISPEFGNNPGFATFQVIDNQAQNLEFKFLNLS